MSTTLFHIRTQILRTFVPFHSLFNILEIISLSSLLQGDQFLFMIPPVYDPVHGLRFDVSVLTIRVLRVSYHPYYL